MPVQEIIHAEVILPASRVKILKILMGQSTKGLQFSISSQHITRKQKTSLKVKNISCSDGRLGISCSVLGASAPLSDIHDADVSKVIWAKVIGVIHCIDCYGCTFALAER